MIGRLIDSLVSAVSPLSGLRRAQARKLLRSYQGGEPSRVASARNPKNQPADMELMGPFGADRLRAWARDMVRNNAYAWGVVDTIVSSVVGCGIKAQSTYETPEGEDIEELNDVRDKVWSEWCEVCDVNGQYTFEEMQAAIQREIVEAGEVLVRIVRTPENVFHGILRPVPLALELIEADRLAGDKDTYAARLSADSGNRIIRGVEVDDLGKPVAYWIYKDHPLQPYAFTRTPERIPANEVLHLFRRDRVGQTRGVTWFAPALSWIRDLGTYVDNELQASAVASCFTVAIKSHTPIGNLFDPDGGTGTDAAGNRQRYVEPGMIMELAPGEDVVGLNPGRPNAGAEPWIGLILRGIAVGTGLSYEVVARDYSQTSYSSSRTSQLEDRRRFRCWQQYLIRHLLQPVWDAFSDAAAISAIQGFATSTELLEDRRKFAPVEWQTPEWEWVDPQSEQTASEMALNSFTDTYQNVLGSRGRSFRSVFYQRAKEERMRKKLGLITPEERQQQISAAQTQQAAQASTPEAAESAPANNGVDVASLALNGAQVTSLVDVITQVGTGAMPKPTAVAVLKASFPTLSDSLVASIIDPIVPGAIAADGTPAPVQQTEQEQRQAGTGEMMGLSTLQFNRNRKAIAKTLQELADKTISQTQAKVFLSSIGMSPENVDALISDALDGTVDTKLPESSDAV
jgi:lambda family phage portal protein